MFNSREYEWADITVILGGRDLTKIRSVKYKEKIEKEPLYGKGRNPFSIQSGNASYEGELVLFHSEIIALERAGNGSLLGLSVDVVVSYGNPSTGAAMVTDRIMGVQFTEIEKAYKQGDKFAEITLPFLALGVKNNV